MAFPHAALIVDSEPHRVDQLVREIETIDGHVRFGRVAGVRGLLVDVAGIGDAVGIGSRLSLQARGGRRVEAEVVGIAQGRAQLMAFGSLDGVGAGARAQVLAQEPNIQPDTAWLGRVLDAWANPTDGKGPLRRGAVPYALRAAPPPAYSRQRVGPRIDLGVRVLNAFTTCCRGQRLGIFAGSGVGKSVLLSMLARYSDADVTVIGLIGERGREAREFIEDDLGPEGLARSVVVVATSDEPALARRQAAYTTLAVAEYFRDQGKNVLLLMDSVTRFALAQREIGLSAGEPPTTKGYTPTVFSELPKLLERAGPGTAEGSITGLFTVLVEGDDHNEPIADAVRGILDGHVVLERAIGERGRYPAVNVLRSISRAMPGCNGEGETKLIGQARRLLSTYEDMAELIRLGAYRTGTDPAVDEAIRYRPAIEAFLTQGKNERDGMEEGFSRLAALLEGAAA
jgi:flagellum-specific ATP synthase